MSRLIRRILMVGLTVMFIGVGVNSFAGTTGYFANADGTVVIPAYLVINEHPDFYYQDFTGEGFLKNDGVVALECEKPVVKAVVKAIVINAGALFDFDKSTIREGDMPVLDKLASFLNVNTDIRIKIAGHTCNIGTNMYNARLSEARADAVKTYFVDKGVDAGRMETVGFGENQPAFDNDTRENRAKNRRVEVTQFD